MSTGWRSDCDRGQVAIVGVGTIGAGWAALFAAYGYKVALYDEYADCLDRSLELIEASLSFMFAHSLVDGEGTRERAEEARRRIVRCEHLAEALADAELVQESIVEDYARKSALYDTIEELLPAETPVSSSSSGLLISKLQHGRRHPERFLIGHPWNPPYLIPLVELVPGPHTSADILDEVRSIYETLGMNPVLVRREVPGHIGNRLAAALWREAIDLVTSGVATVEDVDKAVRFGPGLRWALMGVHLPYHLGGGLGGIAYFVEHLQPAFESWWSDMADWSYMPPGAKQALVDGIQQAVGDQSYEEMVAKRDNLLVGLLKLTASEGMGPGAVASSEAALRKAV